MTDMKAKATNPKDTPEKKHARFVEAAKKAERHSALCATV
jgi:hypothetical protein